MRAEAKAAYPEAFSEINLHIRDNRRRLVDLIYEMGAQGFFAESDLLSRFKEERSGDFSIDSRRSIKSYLQELVEIGVLEYQAGRYRLS